MVALSILKQPSCHKIVKPHHHIHYMCLCIPNKEIFKLEKHIIIMIIYCLIALIILFKLFHHINGKYSESSQTIRIKQALLSRIHTASPALITGGRNIAFETGNGVSNSPASYLNMLDCCESDEAISSRIAIGKTKCKIIKSKTK